MALLFLLGLILIGGAVAILARAATMSRVRVSATMRSIDSYGAGTRSVAAPVLRTPRRTPVAALADKLGKAVPFGAVPARLLRAGGMYNVSAERFQGYRVLVSVAVPGLLLAMVLLSGKLSVLIVVVIVLVAAICWFLAPTVVRTRGQRRLDAVDRALPQLIDVLTATVEAGMGFAGSLQVVAGRFDGPLGQELRLMLQEQSMGLSPEQALGNLLERCETPSVRAFVRSVSQGESLGVSIGTMLRNLAVETRKRRSQLAREQMTKAPVKMLFPLVLLMLPALFIVLMYPAIASIVHTFSH